MSLYPDLKKLNLNNLILRFQGNSPDGEDFATNYYTEVAQLITQEGKTGIHFLLGAIEDADINQLRAIIYVLSSHQFTPPEFQEQLRTYLHHQNPLIVAEAIDGLSRQRIKVYLKEIQELKNHVSPYVRGSLLRFMRNLYPDQSFPILIQALEDSDFIVRENAVDELGELGKVEAIPRLRPLLQDAHSDVRQATQTAIEILESIQSSTKLDKSIV